MISTWVRIEHGEDVREQFAPRVADRGPVASAFQQVDAELPLQAAHGLAQRGLGDVEFLRGATERAKTCHLGEIFELLDPHGHRPASRGHVP
jgi:hypothetical protein